MVGCEQEVCVCVGGGSLPAASVSVCRTKAEIKRGTCFGPELQVVGHVGRRVLGDAVVTDGGQDLSWT